MKLLTDFEYIPTPKSDIKYKRILYLGIRKKKPLIEEELYPGSHSTIEYELEEVGLYPCLVIWEEYNGEKRYAEAT